MRLVLFCSLALATACASTPPPAASDGESTPAKPTRPPRRLGFGGGGAGKAELQAAIEAAKKNDLDLVIEKCRAAIAKNPNLEQAYLLMGSAHSLGDDVAAERLAYQEGLAALPTSMALLSEAGFLELQDGKFDAAVAHYEKAKEISDSKNADVLAHLAYAHGLAGRMSKALTLAEAATTLDEKCARCAAIHGRLLMSTKKVDEAIPMFERARRLDANDVDAANQLAKAYFLSKKYDEAAKLYGELVAKTDDPGLRNEYAVVLMKQKRYAEASSELKKLTEAFGTERSLFERLLEAQNKAGDKKGAAATKKKLKELP